MALSSVLFLFLTHLGLGVALTLPLVSREAGVKFFRFNAGLAAILIATGLAFRPEAAEAARTDTVATWAIGAAEAALVVYWATVGRALATLRPWLLGVVAFAGLATLVADGLAVASGASGLTPALAVASTISSAALLGGACTAMILGHWYLVLPSLHVSHLQSIVRFHIFSIVVRVLVVAAAVFVAIATWEPGAGPSFRHYIFSVNGIFFWQRVLFGLAGPAVLSYLTWETAKIQSTQSATGILYVDFFTVIVGEVLAKYLVLATRVPV